MNLPKFLWPTQIRLLDNRRRRFYVEVLLAMGAVLVVVLMCDLYIGSGGWHKFTLSEKIVDRIYFAIGWLAWTGAAFGNCGNLPFGILLGWLLGWLITGLLWATVFELFLLAKRRISTLAAVSLLIGFCAIDLWMTSDFHRFYNFPVRNVCINNLRVIDAAKQQWGLEHGKNERAIPTWNDLIPYLGRAGDTNLPKCPEEGQYFINNLSRMPQCTITGHSLNSQP